MLSQRVDDPTFVYKAYDATGALLYVGMSVSPWARLKAHAGASEWWGDTAHVVITGYADRISAHDAEIRSIHIDGPAHNRQRYPATATPAAQPSTVEPKSVDAAVFTIAREIDTVQADIFKSVQASLAEVRRLTDEIVKRLADGQG